MLSATPLSIFLLAVAASGADPCEAAEAVAGPVEAQVVRVIDGDTFEAVAHVWPGHSVRVSVRGIDAPEMKSRCPAERAAAEAARQALEDLVADAPVLISNIGGGKYYGRVLADVTAHDGRPAAGALLGGGHARSYDGGKRTAYCGRSD